jgi:hypothetical protein
MEVIAGGIMLRYTGHPSELSSAIGMLKYWNDGIMGSGKMG